MARAAKKPAKKAARPRKPDRDRSLPDPITGLTGPEENFVQHLLLGKTQYRAYIMAFPHAEAWNETSVYPEASRLANSHKVRARLAELRVEARRVAATAFEFDLTKWQQATVDAIQFSVADLVDADGNVLPPHLLPPHALRMIDRVKFKDGNWEYQLTPRSVAREQYGRHLGAYLADNRQKADANMVQFLEYIAERGKLPVVHDVEDAVAKPLPPAPVGAIVPRRG